MGRLKNFAPICLLISLSLISQPAAALEPAGLSGLQFPASDWPFWRGPDQNGVASAKQTPPTSWSETENVLWRAEVPGRGHSSPVVIGDRVFITSADHEREVQIVLGLDRATGKQLWETIVHRGGFETRGKKMNLKATLASSTIASDGSRLFINFLNDNAVWTTALDLDGKQLWQTRLTDYQVHQGYGSSPTIYKNLVISSADNKAGGAIVAMDRTNGEIVWRRERPELPNYPSPVVVKAAGRDQLIMTGCDLVTSLDPLTGQTIWEIEGATTECVTTTVTDGKVILTSGGYPDNHISAVAADGSGKIVWENTDREYVPSMLIAKGHVFAILDAGIATCLNVETGEQIWKERLGGTFSSSPVLVGENIYVTSESGKTHIFKASVEGFQSVATNSLGSKVFATPAICGGQIFTRVSLTADEKTQEYVYCLADSAATR
ncbi:Polyvinylalcohol dehydrogenase precursor [Rosistilla oblonga]|uniref:outer membrane protein assembly factor BamB family protein n=1 Tax=Rosistilla oblonga TaxID=2527990 RepID=UPI00118AC901|nr:PQQ-binding-like beta-propeller repeat protein [Rosistilla oblonga]QDV11553.1 Polyvinylalcohol dehydrogenase precursor [Rosistilla oblonga]